jgi:adenylate kinase
MNKTVVVTGIPGTGKTTVCGFVEKLAGKAAIPLMKHRLPLVV